MMLLDAIAWLAFNPIIGVFGLFALHGLAMLFGGKGRHVDV